MKKHKRVYAMNNSALKKLKKSTKVTILGTSCIASMLNDGIINQKEIRMRIISRRTLNEFASKHSASKNLLDAWFHEVKKAVWKSPADIKAEYKSADFLKNNRVVFNIGGNNYRLIVKIHYNVKAVYIRFVGTHAEYNKINAEKI